MSRAEMKQLGWDELDVLFVSGDGYLDHPAHGCALLGRWLISHGFRCGIVAQPRWQVIDDFLVMGRPRLFVGIGAGAVDSLLAHYTAFRNKRKQDAYTPAGEMGKRPNRACIVYTNMAKKAFPKLPIVLGSIEASTRRLTHYDFWTDSLRKPLLLDAKADLLVYGMGELALLEVARRLESGKELVGIPGTVWQSPLREEKPVRIPTEYADRPCICFPSYEQIVQQKEALLTLALAQDAHVHAGNQWAYQVVGNQSVVVAEPARALTTAEMDAVYDLPYTRRAHPSYQKPLPAEEMLKTSITSHRGCGGGCSFCSLSMHQGRKISSR
ncbi:MAG: YgiQ family radical SAM protein, partial [Desulfovibrio sp.]|nr:YgiQ family radical SAM protein [Desulfovibrio sp.]